ncbi:hypothetical protein M427DRAFT_433554 [Gonapodya prolifera JEL478]|uniref:SH3 domain-containing protein n=1 Tax=Gonapodya prolifera (strain JEL478) TaxID=1344416 RepID=A0A139ATN7_GONPJ|nr:hypothetical protein M427DRAFT_433554 [Gonapodya prolifera JEL478]|eukprot:KXS19933.1 hypothetical protein M427DRAFT_433554 [Gonapodya prolifera JEL478]
MCYDTGAALSTASVSLAANYTVPADPNNTTNIDFGDGLSSGAVAGAGGGISSDFGLVRTLIVVGATALLCAFVATVVGWWYIRQRRPLALYHSVLPMSKNADGESTGSTDDGPSRTKRIWDKLGLGSGSAEESVGSRSPSATFIPVDSKSPPPELPSGSRQMLPPPSISSNLHPLSINRDGSVLDDVSDSSSSVRNGKPSSPRGVAPSPTPSARRARLADLIAPVPRGAFTPGPGSHSESNLSSLGSSGASSESEGESGSRFGGPHAPVSDRVTSTVGPPGLSQARKSALGKPYTVILPHKPHAPDEIALRRADAVFIFEVYTDSWAYGLNASTGREGIFPMSAVAQVGGVGTAGPAPGGSGVVFQ